MSNVKLLLPAQFKINTKLFGNPIFHLLRSEISEDDVEVAPDDGNASGHIFTWGPKGKRTSTLVTNKKVARRKGVDEVLLVPSGIPTNGEDFRDINAKWLSPAPQEGIKRTIDDWKLVTEAATTSWDDQFFFRTEVVKDGNIIRYGLRYPQIGAIHAAHSRWTVAHDPSTIVMPTGTGKTETMLALLVSQKIERLLVVVPNTALREQIAHKFISLGLLKKLGIVGTQAQYPVVGILEHRPKTIEEVESFFRCCNVVITNIHVAGGCSEEIQRTMGSLCSHLFIDEAHHIPADSWARLRRHFLSKTILQFTATPFRRDRKHIDGQVIYDYPLRKAQEEDYFRPITFRPITEYSRRRSDIRIAEIAIEQLNSDIKGGFNHLVMARASKKDRATEIHAIYEQLAPHHKPLLVHSDIKASEQATALKMLREGDSRILVCVDMFGEGFDLPELKIAALHDMHKSLAITLQFAGRFTRTKPNFGSATMIANIADAEVEEALRDLYAEDSDWNHILRLLSAGATKRHEKNAAYLAGFADPPDEIPLQNVFPKMSAVVYRVKRDHWVPEDITKAVKSSRIYAGPTVHAQEKLCLLITRERTPIPWGTIREIQDTIWDLYLLHYDEKQKLLFINSSNNDSLHDDLAKAVCGEDVDLVRGEEVFRSLHNVNRLVPMNFGVKHSLSRAVRFSMYIGSDITQGLTEAFAQGKIKSNIFGLGFENGEKVSVGCSQKGRIWSYKVAYQMEDWVEWCQALGKKLIDTSISTEMIFKNLVVPKQLSARPSLVPLTIEWSEAFLHRNEESITVEVNGDRVPFYEVGLELTAHEDNGPIMFRVYTEKESAEFEVCFNANSVEYRLAGHGTVEVEISKKKKELNAWFQLEPPVIRFFDGSFLIYNEFCEVPHGNQRTPFAPDRISAWDWTGTDLTKESQRQIKRPDSIQFKVIQQLFDSTHDPQLDIIFDDDGAGESADIVGLKVAGERLLVHLYHLKFSHAAAAGARVADLYEVCGQAQRSAYWKADVRGLLAHLRHRETVRQQNTGVTRFEKGDLNRLLEISREAPYLTPEFKIFIVQPGVSKSEVTLSQLELLAATELYLMDTYGIELSIIGSA